MYTLRAIRKSYGDKAALNGISFETPRGKTTVLIGPSGCGKSTVFGLMTGLLKPDGGEIIFDGQPINSSNVQSIRRRIGYVIQDGGLFPHLTGLANVTLMARHLGWNKSRVDGRVEELTKLTRLAPDILLRYPLEMSGGQRQRISLMRALMLDADVLLLDEPLGALDPMVRAELQDDLAKVFQELKRTVVLVTHDMNEAAFFGHQIVLMRGGEIVQIGAAADLLERPSQPFVTQFVKAQERQLLAGGVA